MRIQRVRVLVLLGAICGLSLTAPAMAAAAQPYPPGPPSLTATPATVVVGGTVTVEGNNFGACDVVTIDVSYTSAAGAEAAGCGASVGTQEFDHSVTADGNGHFVTSVTLTQVGTATITASGFPSGLSASATVTVLAAGSMEPAAASEDGLSVTRLGALVAGVGLPLLALATIWQRRPKGKHR